MANFRKRRRKRVIWLPNEANAGQPPTVNFRTDVLSCPAAVGTLATTVYALTVDYPAEAVQAAGPQPPSVADYVQSGFLIERIVGKFVVGVSQRIGDVPPADSYPSAIAVAMGLIVLRVDELTGAPLRAATPNEYSPFADDNERDPFFFRRTWVLGNDLGFGVTTTDLQPLSNCPRTNIYGSGPEGTFIDTQTKRLVQTEQRVFLVVSATNIGSTTTQSVPLGFYFDYRILVAPRTMSNRNNASR